MITRKFLIYTILFLALFTACTTEHVHDDDNNDHHGHSTVAPDVLELPTLTTAEKEDGTQINVVATTSIIGDIVGNIGGDAISLTTLMDGSTDPHSYQPTPNDLIALETADVIFINGWGLEEQIVDEINENYTDKAVPVSAGIKPLVFDEGGADPHVWFSIDHTTVWTENIATILQQLAPSQADIYATNKDNYQAELATLSATIDQLFTDIPASKRYLVTHHDALGYLADIYDFEVIGNIIPSFSTNAEPSARDLSELVTKMTNTGICTIFAENSDSQELAKSVAAELDHCEAVQLLPLDVGIIGSTGSYIDMYHQTVKTIAEGLQD